MSLKNQTINGFSWNLFEGIFSQAVIFCVGILLARILSPEDFGLVGLTTVFIAISTTIVNSGFTQALIRKIDVTELDYNSIFYVNIATAIVLYTILYFTSGIIAAFFKEPLLIPIVKVIGIGVIVSALTLVQRSILTRELNFKLQAIISIISSVVASTISLIIAYQGYGVWSLVFLNFLKQLFNCILLWIFNSWRPQFIFSKNCFKELFWYSYKLLISELINTVYSNIYYFIIGKVYSPTSLGYYTRADSFQKPFASNISLGIKRISFPIFSKIQNNEKELKLKFRKFIRFNTMLSSLIMFFLMGAAKPIVLILIGVKWQTSIFYMQLLCIPGLLYGLQILNLNLLTVKGFSNLNLKLEVVKKIVLIPLVIVSSFFSIEILLYSFVGFSIIEFFINSFYTNKLIKYSIIEQLKDIFIFFIIGFIGFLFLYLILFLDISLIYTLIFQVIFYIMYYVLIIYFFRLPEFKEILIFINSIKNKYF